MLDRLPRELRPHSNLLVYYALCSAPVAMLPLLPLYFRYHTLRYRFDAEGLTMSWGILFRRQISLAYARIQDIHLVSNLVERWLGLARIQVQTASGAAGAEMTIEGLHEFEAIRDFLYDRMRGARAHREAAPGGQAASEAPAATDHPPVDGVAELARSLDALAVELARLRAALERDDVPHAPGPGGPA